MRGGGGPCKMVINVALGLGIPLFLYGYIIGHVTQFEGSIYVMLKVIIGLC